jgi:hypothetical protein
MYYSKMTGGFYDPAIHGERLIERITIDLDTGATLDRWTEANPDTKIPADAVEITAEEHAALLQGQSQGQRIGADGEGRPVLQAPPLPSHAELVEQALQAARKERQPILSVLDGLQSSALATGNGGMATLIETAKQSLRDITSLDLSACVTYEDMRQAFKARYAQLVAAAPEVAIAFNEVVA